MTVIMPKLKGSYNIIDIYLKHPHFDAHINRRWCKKYLHKIPDFGGTLWHYNCI